MKNNIYIWLRYVTLLLFISITFPSLAQNIIIPPEYFAILKEADSLFNKKEYLTACFTYEEAFRANNRMALANDLYRSAECWSLANYPDSSFRKLTSLSQGDFLKHETLLSNNNFNNLHSDKRWDDILKQIQERDVVDMNIKYLGIRLRLDSIHVVDQHIRSFPNGNLPSPHQLDNRRRIDSLNLIEVEKIINENGWLGADEIGTNANTTLFLVIQHSRLETQEKYLPIIKKAVETGDASSRHLAYLVDRIEIQKGNKQIYGTQLYKPEGSEKYMLHALADPENVDTRRKAMGLEKLSEYLAGFGIKD